MAWVVNKSDRVISVGGFMLTPLTPVEVDDSLLDNDRVKEIMKDSHIEKCDPPSTSAAQPATDSTNKQPPIDVSSESKTEESSDNRAKGTSAPHIPNPPPTPRK